MMHIVHMYVYFIIHTAPTKTIPRHILKITDDKSKWNSKQHSSTHLRRYKKAEATENKT